MVFQASANVQWLEEGVWWSRGEIQSLEEGV